MPSNSTCQPMPQAPSVGDSQLSSSKRMSCCARVDAARLEALEIELLHFVGRRLEDHLELVVLEQAVRVLAEAAVGRPPRRLHVGDVPVRGPEHAQERLGVHRAGADLEVERLLQRAAARRPELRQLEDETLKRHRDAIQYVASPAARATDFRSFSRCIAISARCAASSSRSAARATPCTRAERERAATLRAASRNAARLGRQPRDPASVDALQPQQPVLEVARQRLDRHAGARSRRPSTRRAGTASRSDRPPAPTRRSARRSSST